MGFSKYTFFLLFFFLLRTDLSVAQQYNFKNFTPKNGLASSTINGVFQDSKGYIWFSTPGGVSRFNGKTFKNFTKSEGLVANEVNYVTEDRKGNIWIATLDGVSRFDGVHFKNYTSKDGLANNSVYWIMQDDKGMLWFATRGGGVSMFDGKKFTSFTTKDGLVNDIVFSITHDKKGYVWFGCQDGLTMYDGKRMTAFTTQEALKGKTFFCAYQDSKGTMWFGSTDGALIKSDGNSFEQILLPEETRNDFIGGITEDKKGNIWLATDHGVLKYENGSFHLFDDHQGLSANEVLSLSNDYEGNIWIGTGGGGVDKFNNESFVNYIDKDGLISKNISTMLQYDDENYIIGTTGLGLNFFNSRTNSFSTSSGIAEIDQSKIYSVLTDHSKNVWVGAQDGVFELQKQNNRYNLVKAYKKVDSMQFLANLKIIEDRNNAIWIASYGSGVFKIKDGAITNYSVKSGFPSDNTLTVFEDSKGMIWIGTKDAGLVKYDGRKFISYGAEKGFEDKAVWSITEDNNGVLYFGTGEHGLCYYDGKQFRTMSVKDGLCSNYILALQFDNVSNCLWIGTEKGINKLTFRENFAIASLRYYGDQEGYKGIEINQNAILLDKKGQVWFGTINGLCRYNRQYDSPNITPPKLHLNGIRLAYEVVDWKNYADSVDPSTNLPVGLELSHKNNNLTFDFQAFTTDNVRYTFMLEGQDENWSPLSPNAEAVFTNINPGHTYTFKVKAVNSNGVWSNQAISYTFSIKPPWWQTWWFYTLVVSIILLSIYSFINYRTAQLAKEKKVLEEKVTERTHELKEANDQLSVAFQDIKDSINYAKKIQDAILPLEEEIKKALPESFVLFKPRDVVSGDFYWFNKKDDKIYIAAVDCTGHGVPGAFMSMIGSSLLNEIISKKGPHDAASVLKQLHRGVRKSLKQDRDSYESKDGMDLALSVIDTVSNTIQYSGAKRPLFYFSTSEFQEIKADKQSIGGLEMEDNYQFTNHNFEIRKGETYYMFTDGYVDQFGGEHEKKFSTKRFKETLNVIQHLSMKEQQISLDKTIEAWKSHTEQIDDILVIGIRF